MESYYNIIKINKIKKLLESDQKEEAYKLAVTIEPAKIKNVMDMITLADAFAQNKEYKKAKDLFWRVYEKTGSKRALSQMLHLSIKSHELEDAKQLLDKFDEAAPDDSYRLIFRFQIDKLQQASNETLIHTLEQLKKVDYMEHWAYELAKLYHKEGDKDKCINECNDIILWFGEGEYVEWAKVLRGHHMGEIDIAQMQQRQDEISLAKEVEKAITGDNSAVHEFEFDTDSDYENKSATDDIREIKQQEEVTGKVVSVKEDNVSEQESPKIKNNKSYEDDNTKAETVAESEDEVSSELSDSETINADETGLETENTKEDTNDVTGLGEEKNNVTDTKEERSEDADTKEIADDSSKAIDTVESGEVKLTEETELDEQKQLEEKEQEAIEREAIRYIEELFRNQDEDIEINKESFQNIGEKIPKSKADIIEADPNESIISENDSEVANNETTEVSENQVEAVENETEVPENQVEAVENETAKLIKDTSEDIVPLKNEKNIKIADMNRSEKFDIGLNENGRLIGMLDEAELSLDELFGNYIHLSSVRSQLLRALDSIFDGRSKNLNLIITGGSHCGKTILAKRLAKMMYRFQELKTVRIALISAEKLNGLDIKTKKDQLIDCCLIIQNAGKLSQSTVESLLMLSPEFAGHTAVVLEDSRNSINHLLRDNKSLGESFQLRIHLPNTYKAEELIGFAYDYFLERDYEITEEADRALKLWIDELWKKSTEDTIGTLNKYLRKVLDKAEKRAAKSLMELAASGKYEESDIMILQEADFIL